MNKIEEFTYICELYTIYKNLFTDKQTVIMDRYYIFNLSLSEIAEELNISRSAVDDVIDRCKNKLFEYEKSLSLYKRNNNIKNILDKASIDDKIKNKILEEL